MKILREARENRSASLTHLMAMICLCSAVFFVSCVRPESLRTTTGEKDKVPTIYVSPEGNDQLSGTQAFVSRAGFDGPVRTAKIALQKIRSLRALGNGKSTSGGRILFLRGTYFLDEPLLLGWQDSGLVIAGDTSGMAIISGGRRISGWKTQGNYWAASLSEIKQGKWDFRQLSVNGELRSRARLPQKGLFEHESVFNEKWMMTTGGGFKTPPTGEQKSTMVYAVGQLPELFSLKNAEFIIYHQWDASWSRAIAHNPKTHTLRFDPPLGWPPGSFGVKLYAVENIKEGMTKPGQWYLDRDEGTVVYWPLPGEDINHAVIEAPVRSALIRIEGIKEKQVEDVTVSNLTLELINVNLAPAGWGARTLDGAISLNLTRNCRLNGLTILRAGGQGIKVINSSAIRIEDSEVHFTGANGIVIEGGDGNVVSNNLVDHTGLIYLQANGINIFNTKRSIIAHNEVTSTSYTGISVGNGMADMNPTENVIEYNKIWDVMKSLNDGGCIYLSGRERFSRVRGNVLHDSFGLTGIAVGLYLDEQVEDVTCEDNLVFNISNFILHVHMARQNVVRNNIFIGGPGRKISFTGSSDCTFEKNIVYAPTTGIAFINQAGAKFDNNLYYAGAKPIENGPVVDPGSRIDDPEFINPNTGDFRLRDGSPAFTLGFKAFDFLSAGRLK